MYIKALQTSTCFWKLYVNLLLKILLVNVNCKYMICKLKKIVRRCIVIYSMVMIFFTFI